MLYQNWAPKPNFFMCTRVALKIRQMKRYYTLLLQFITYTCLMTDIQEDTLNASESMDCSERQNTIDSTPDDVCIL